jgi:pantothenate kinase type III
MVSVLLTGTSDLAGRAAWASAADPAWFANNTRDAIEKGCRLALARLAEDALRRLPARAGAKPRLQLTGGDAELLAPWLDVEFDLVPDLVLRGLARLVEFGQIHSPGCPSGPSRG